MATNIVGISEMASLGLHTMALLARHRDRHISNVELATTLHASGNTLAKVLPRLARAGLIESVRGPRGGFTLARAAECISLLDIYEAIEGPIGTGGCLLGSPVCSGPGCPLGGLVQSVHQQIRNTFASTSLAQLADSLPFDLSDTHAVA